MEDTKQKVRENKLRRGGRAALASEAQQQARRVHLDDHGLYMLIEAGGNCVVRGSFDATLEDIEGVLGARRRLSPRDNERQPHEGFRMSEEKSKTSSAGQAGQFDLVAGKVVASPLTLMLLDGRCARIGRKPTQWATNSTTPAIQNP